MRHSLNFCGWKDRKNVAKDLKRVYQAVDDEDAAKALDDFEAEWGRKYPSIAPSWQRAWQEVNPFFAFPPAVRKIIYTTNAIESLNRVIRKTTKTRGSFPTPSRARIRHTDRGSRYLLDQSMSPDTRQVGHLFVSGAYGFQLPTSCQLLVFAARNPSSRSDNRVKPRQMTVVPGGGSLFRSKYPPRRATAVM